MPNINSIPEVLYEPNQPYHYYYDNLPLRNILTRIGLVNIQVETNADMLRGVAGSAGSLNARLGASLEADGTIKNEAIDSSLHGICHHKDGDGPDGVAYVRMTADERAKLALIQSESNRLLVEIEDQFPTIGSYVTFLDGVLRLGNSSTIFFDFEAPNVVKAHSAFPPDVAHRHNYDKTPVHAKLSSPNYRNYKTTSVSTSYMDGSLRVYVNGVKISNSAVPVPNLTGSSFTATYIESESNSQGTFTLNRSISSSDVIRIDFDQAFFETPSSSSSSGGSSVSSSSSSSSSSSDSSSVFGSSSSSSAFSSSSSVPEGMSTESSSSSQVCNFIECGGGLAYADCELLVAPGYVSYMDCDICECVTVAVSSSSSEESSSSSEESSSSSEVTEGS